MLDKSGMAPWEICALCHSADGVSVMPKFPKLAGQKVPYIERQIMQFRLGGRANDGGQMQAISTEVELQDVAKIAVYFASLPAPSVVDQSAIRFSETEYVSRVGRGRSLFYAGDKNVPACAKCHADKNSAAPWIDRQHRDYIEKQLLDFRSGKRRDSVLGVMPGIAEKLTDFDVASLALFLEQEALDRN